VSAGPRRAPRRSLFLLAALVLAADDTRPQAARDTDDLQSRAGIRLDVDLPRKWEVDVEYQYRMVDDLSTYRGSYMTVEADYRLRKWVTAIAAYRRSITNEGDANRFAGGIALETRLDRLRVSFRPLLQHRSALVEDDEVGGDGRTFVRTRLRLEYPVTKKLDVYAQAEPFFGFAGDYPIDNWRNSAGLKYAFTKAVGVELSYIYRPDYGKAENRLYHVLGLTLRLDAKVGGRKGPRE
jgi:hypothetical protein